MTEAAPPLPATDRVVRVFVSSTFRDMKAERDELVKHVFPQLRKLCEERGVTWADVDLRWGITDEQSAEGEVLPICLAEIQRCRPYFIGLLGERYGWVPEAIDQELLDEQPWLAEHRDRSVTELEILHGVLNDPAMADRSSFYLRDPAYADRVSEDQRDDFVESDPTLRGKLTGLKDRIRESGLALRENYPDPETLGQWVLDDLTKAIDAAFPIESKPDALARDTAGHEAFARSRTGVYIGRQEYLERLDAHAAGDGPPLVALGESGSGKSALLANWLAGYRTAHPDVHTIVHFIGANAYSTDWAAMVRRIMGELHARFGIEQEIPDPPDALRLAFANCLSMAAARGRVVLVIDALNQLEDRNGALDLVWLPPAVPANVRLVVSTLPGRPLDDLTRREWPTLTLQPLDVEERSRLIEEYLAQYTKRLSGERAERIATSPQAANPLYLRALLEELRVFGEHERLDAPIGHYLTADSVPALYEKILDRYEQDYERGRPGLVRDAMSLLWASRLGLSEPELIELLGTDGQPLPRAHWSALYLALDKSLVSRSGLIGFFHDYLREAVEHRCLPDEATRDEAHLRLADYFTFRDLTPRKVGELPWQLASIHAWQRLYDLLAEASFFQAAWAADPSGTKAYWAQVESGSSLNLLDAYQALLRKQVTPETYSLLWDLGALLKDTGHLSAAAEVQQRVVDGGRREGYAEVGAGALSNLGGSLRLLGRYRDALAAFEEAEQIAHRQGDARSAMTALNGQANVLVLLGRGDEALDLYRQAEEICSQAGNTRDLQDCLGNQAVLLLDRGQVQEAMPLLSRQEQLCRQYAIRDGLMRCLANQASAYHKLGQTDRVLGLLGDVEDNCRKLGDRDELARCLNRRALVLTTHGRLPQALVQLDEAIDLATQTGDRGVLQACWGNKADVLVRQGLHDAALALYERQEELAREVGQRNAVASALGGQAGIHHRRNELDAALGLYEQQESLCTETGSEDGRQAAIGNQALIHLSRKEVERAAALLDTQEAICRATDNAKGMQHCLNGKAALCAARGDAAGAIRLYEEQEKLCQKTGDVAGQLLAMTNRALRLAGTGSSDGLALGLTALGLARRQGLTAQANQIESLLDHLQPASRKPSIASDMTTDSEHDLGPEQLEMLYERALQCNREGRLDESEGILRHLVTACRQEKRHKHLQRALGVLAEVCHARKRPEDALQYITERTAVCGEIGDDRLLAESLGNQAIVYNALSQRDKALDCYARSERLWLQCGDIPGLVNALANQALVLARDLNRTGDAKVKIVEAVRLVREHQLSSLQPNVHRIQEYVLRQG
ncbi:tetratricopeptide repeat protein [bacterium]|nr:tetratricopeptide repeat protein [bacterium]